jgi:ABC-type dipeptide/oligopeptide/nickel transport system permease component
LYRGRTAITLDNRAALLWPNLSLGLLVVALGLTAAVSQRPIAWARARPVAVAALQLSAVVAVSWWLISEGAAAISSSTFTPAPEPDLRALFGIALQAAWRSLWLVLAASALGAVAGFGGSILLSGRALRRAGAYDALAALLWVVPTFLVAALVQEVQAQVFNYTGSAVGGGYGTSDPRQVFWSALVLGIRPAVYVFRSARRVLAAELDKHHVRAARARGLPERAVLLHHATRPSAAALLSGWLNSLRLMIGSLPLIEFLFGYPGLGRSLVLALGITYGFGTQQPQPQPDLAIMLVALLACLMIGADFLIRFLQRVLDPRLEEVRLAA